MESTVWYQDWMAWSSIVAWLSFAIGLAPWFWKKFKKADPVFTPHTSVGLSHRLGITNLNWFLRVENDGGADLDITSIDFIVSDESGSLKLPVWTFYKNPTDVSVFAGFKLKSGESWQGTLASSENIPADDQREHRYIVNETRKQLPAGFNVGVNVSEELQARIINFYRKHFRFKSRGYEVVIRLNSRNGGFYDSQKYRFILYESDVSELQSHSERFLTGDGITWNSNVDVWLQVPVVKA